MYATSAQAVGTRPLCAECVKSIHHTSLSHITSSLRAFALCVCCSAAVKTGKDTSKWSLYAKHSFIVITNTTTLGDLHQVTNQKVRGL